MNGKNYIWALILGVSLFASVIAASNAFKNRYNWKDTVAVTGLGEVEFVSDYIVWDGYLTANSQTLEQGYAEIESNGKKVRDYLNSQGIADSLIQFMFVNNYTNSEPIYNGNTYIGQRNTGYGFRQQFKVQGADVDLIERVSREISTLIASGIMIESMSPSYYYTRLEDVKMTLIENATNDARDRAEKIASKAGAKLGKLSSAKAGIIQITAPNSNEDYSWGGTYNVSSREKKASVTMKLEYHIK